MSLNKKIIFFDFDGVIKRSNEAKGHAFIRCFKSASEETKEKILIYHLNNPSLSRAQKLKHIYNLVYDASVTPKQLQLLLQKFQGYALQSILHSAWIPGVVEVIQNASKHSRLVLVTAMPTKEAIQVLSSLKIDSYFSNVIGFPKAKSDGISESLIQYSLPSEAAIFFGDAVSDYYAAQKNLVDFCLVKNNFNISMHAFDDIYIISDFTAIHDDGFLLASRDSHRLTRDVCVFPT